MNNKKKTREELREIANASTKVVAWYDHADSITVRGPFGRWFTCSGGDNGMNDPTRRPTPVSSTRDDCRFAAAAMNNLVFLLDELDAMEQKVADLQLELILMGRHVEDAAE